MGIGFFVGFFVVWLGRLGYGPSPREFPALAEVKSRLGLVFRLGPGLLFAGGPKLFGNGGEKAEDM